MTKKLIIDAGHGGTDPGAVNGKVLEKDWNLRISLYQQKRFRDLGVDVALTRTTDHGLDSSARTKIVRDSKAAYCISNHLNAGGGDRGEVIHSIHSDGKFPQKIKDELVAAGQTTVKVYSRTSEKSKAVDFYYMHRETGNVQTVIVEYCFMDNAVDYKHFADNWEAYAEAVVKAFCAQIGHKYEAPGKPVAPPAVNTATQPAKSDYAKELEAAIEYVKEAGISDGSNPNDPLTRGQFFIILHRQAKGGKN